MKRPAVRVLGVCAAIALLAGCSFRQNTTFTVTGANGEDAPLAALSPQALSGTFSFKHDERYRYELEQSLNVPAASAFSVSYALSNQAQTEASPPRLLLTFEKPSPFILPISFDFMMLDPEIVPSRIRYVMPVSAPVLHSLNFETQTGATDKDMIVQLLDMAVVPRRYGYELSANGLLVTPFVGVKRGEDGKRLVVLDPPGVSERFELRLGGIQGAAALTTGKARYEFPAGNKGGKQDITLPHTVFGKSPFPVTFEGESDAVVLLPVSLPAFPLEPVHADPGIILTTPTSSWRDGRYEVYRWDIFPQVLIFDVSNYDFQDRLFRRLAFYAEKKGYRGKLVPDAELEGKHGWNAHDYRAETLAAFFNEVARQRFPLLPEERELEMILTANHIIRPAPGGLYTAGEGAVVSISRDSSPELRARFMTHECFHGIFFIDENFRDFSASRYAVLNTQAKRFIRSYFDYLAYDIQDDYLMVNEFMAYLLQQPANQAADYFGKYAAGKIEESDWRKSVLPPKDEDSGTWPLLAETFASEARVFSNYAADRWNLAAGRVWRVLP